MKQMFDMVPNDKIPHLDDKPITANKNVKYECYHCRCQILHMFAISVFATKTRFQSLIIISL